MPSNLVARIPKGTSTHLRAAGMPAFMRNRWLRSLPQLPQYTLVCSACGAAAVLVRCLCFWCRSSADRALRWRFAAASVLALALSSDGAQVGQTCGDFLGPMVRKVVRVRQTLQKLSFMGFVCVGAAAGRSSSSVAAVSFAIAPINY